MAGPSYFYAFPLCIGGGAFLTVVAMGILAGAAFYERRNVLLALFGGLGVALACASGSFLPRGHAYRPVTPLQIGSLVFAIAVEMALLPLLRRWLRPRGERTLTLGILILVGAHFLPMYPAFGPLIVLLAVLVMANAGGALLVPTLPVRLAWLIDGGLKLAMGLLMWFGATALPAFGG